MFEQIVGHLHRIGAVAVEGAEQLQRLGRAAGHDRFEQGDGLAAVGEAEHVAHDLGLHRLAAVALHQGLIQQGQAVADRALGGAGDQGQGVLFDLHPLAVGDAGEVFDEDFRLDAAQIEALAAGQDGHRHLADLGGGEDEFGVRRRLFQRLQQGVEGLVRQHVDFVEDIDLVARLDRRVADALDDVADAVDARVGGGVHLDHVHMLAGHDGGVVAALIGQGQRRTVDGVGLVVQGAGQ